ncbi:MAG TPA: GNAT family N-acetyltransferase [Chryseolinea sp.]|nr:GNAT family N-acetyltransferase [Chryseolinea sp.]
MHQHNDPQYSDSYYIIRVGATTKIRRKWWRKNFFGVIPNGGVMDVQLKIGTFPQICIAMERFVIRKAGRADADAIGSLHAASWRVAYRGLLSDNYLDNDLDGERRKYWKGKMPVLTSREFVLVAETDHYVIGFISVLDIPEVGYAALVDNLHVRPDLRGNGLGKALMRAAAERLIDSGRTNYYLWVLNGNSPAEKFYRSLSGVPADEKSSEFGGKTVKATRFVWDNFNRVLA